MSQFEASTVKKQLKKISFELVFGIIVAISLLWLFATLSSELLENELQGFDTFISNIVFNLQTPWLTKMMTIITHVGDTYTYVAVIIIVLTLLLRKRLKWESLILLITVLGAWGLNTALKMTFQRARPDIRHLVEVGGYSFPSGHAMVAMAAYGIMGYLIVRYLRRYNRQYWPVITIFSSLIFLIGLSRVYLHVHYPSDVIAGFSAGGVWLLTCIYALKILNGRSERKKGMG